MLLIISPAKTLDLKTPAPGFKFTHPDFLDEAEELVNILKQYNSKGIMELMSVNPDLADMNLERFLKWKRPFDNKTAKPALFSFKGEVYNGIKAYDLSEKAVQNAQKSLRILSGLYGVLRPLDLIMPYRLEMGTKLDNPKGKDLYKFWDTKIHKRIIQDIESTDEKVLVNLASNEYYKSILPKKINTRVVTPAFKEERDGGFKMITIYAKKARGLLTRFILENNISNIEDIKAFDMEGYYFNNNLSGENDWVFTR